MTEGTDFLSNLSIEHDPEPLPSIVGGGRTAVEVPQKYRDAVRGSYDDLKAGKAAEAVQRILVPVKPSEMDWKPQTRKREVDGKIEETVTNWQSHPNVTHVINVLRKAAEKEGLGIRVVVDRKDDEEGNKGLLVQKGHVRVRFLGMDRKQRKAKSTEATTPAPSEA